MEPPCRPPSYFESHTFHSLCFHAVSLITIPVNVYGIWLIVSKGDKTFRNAKWVMLNSQVWSTFCNLLFTNLITPFLILPVAGGDTLGFLSFMGVKNVYQMVIGVGTVAQLGASTVIIFENQQNHLVTNGFKLKTRTSRRIFVFVNQLAAFTFFVPTLFRIPDQERVKEDVLKWFTCPPSEFSTLNIFILADEPLLISSLICLILTFYVFEAAFCLLHCVYHLIFNVKQMSSKTKRVQRKFFILICVQILLPFIMIGAPANYVAFSVFTRFHNQILNNMCVIMISLHGLLWTIATILIHDTMRETVFPCCSKNIKNSLKLDRFALQ